MILSVEGWRLEGRNPQRSGSQGQAGRGYYQVFQRSRVGRFQAILFTWAAPGRDASSAGAAAAAAAPGKDAAMAANAAADSAADADPPPTAPTQIATARTAAPPQTLPEFPTVVGAAEAPQRPIHGGNDGSRAAQTRAEERRQVPGDGDDGAGCEDAREAAADEAEADVAEGGDASQAGPKASALYPKPYTLNRKP